MSKFRIVLLPEKKSAGGNQKWRISYGKVPGIDDKAITPAPTYAFLSNQQPTALDSDLGLKT